MAIQDGQAAPSVMERLTAESHRYSFFQLVQLLLRQSEGAVAPGGEGPPRREPIRFRPAANLGFAAAEVSAVEMRPEEVEEVPARTLVTVNFMGLYGPASPMPAHMTEELIWAGADGQVLREFLDLFHHRFISFVYAAWRKYRHYIRFDPDLPDRFTGGMLGLVGIGTDGMLRALESDFLPILRVAGLLNARPHSAAGLEGLLRELFEGLPVRVESLIDRVVRIPEEQTIRLGRRTCRLGDDAVIGESIRDLAGGFRITLRPLSAGRYRQLLPGTPEFIRLVRLTRFYVSDPLEFEVQMAVEAAEVPALRLSPDARLPLGQMSWLSPSGREEGVAVFPTKAYDPLATGDRDRPRAGDPLKRRAT